MTEENTPEENTLAAVGINAAISAVMSEISPVQKDKRNKQQGFDYRGIDDVYNELHSAMAKHKIFTTSEIIQRIREERQARSGGTLLYTTLRICYTFHAPDGSSVTTTVDGEGMDSGDKSSNKAMAVAHKYALLQIFMIPTQETKDSDAEHHEIQGWITEDQVADLESLLEETGANRHAFLKYIGAQSIERIQESAYKGAVAALEKKRKQA